MDNQIFTERTEQRRASVQESTELRTPLSDLADPKNARSVASDSRDALPASKTLVESRILPLLTLVDSGEIDRFDERERLRDVHALLQELGDVIAAAPGQDGIAADPERARRQREQITEEQDRGEFGPATMQALSETLDWLERRQLPMHLEYLRANGLEAPPIVPGRENSLENGRINLNVQPDRMPDDEATDRLFGAVNWLNRAAGDIRSHEEQRKTQMAETITRFITENRLPQGWLRPDNVPVETWLPNATRLVDAAVEARRNVEIGDELRGMSGGNIALHLPPGASPQRAFWSRRLTSLSLDLPQNWQLNDASDVRRLDNLERFIQAESERLAPHVEQLRQSVSNPVQALSWGDWTITGSRAHFDAQGNLTNLTGRDTPAAQGSTAQNVNLLESRYDVTTDPRTGRIIVDQTVQAQRVPIYGYQNMIYENIGNPLHLRRDFAPNDWVTVRSGSEFQLMRASDLSWHRQMQRAQLRGGTAAMVALDTAMVASGAGLVVGAVRGARVAATAAEIAAAVGAESTVAGSGAARLVARAGHGLMTAGAGGLGVLENAGARENAVASAALTGRSIYFLSQSARLLASPLFRRLSGASTAPGAAGDLPEGTARVFARIDRASQGLSVGLVAGSAAEYVNRQRHDARGGANAERVVERAR